MVGGKKPTGAGGYVKFVSVSKNKILGNSTFNDVISYKGDMFESVKKEKIIISGNFNLRLFRVLPNRFQSSV